MYLVVHPAHAPTGHCRHRSFFLWQFGNHCFRGDQEGGNRGRVLQGATHDLGRIDDALADEIAVLAALRVKALGVLVFLHDLADRTRVSKAASRLLLKYSTKFAESKFLSAWKR